MIRWYKKLCAVEFKVEEYITEEEDEAVKLKNQLDLKDNEIGVKTKSRNR